MRKITFQIVEEKSQERKSRTLDSGRGISCKWYGYSNGIGDWRIDKRKLIHVYLVLYFVIMLVYCSINTPKPVGEWDDYSLPVASILKEHNLSISDEDIVEYKKIFPEWEEYIEDYTLSGRFTRNGGEMPWYFPIYSAVCIPFVVILKAIRLPTIYAFSYTNILFFMISLLVVYKYMKAAEKKRWGLILILSIHPVIFYFGWISAEVFIYSCLVVAMVCWYNQWYKRGAVAVSVAGMLNPTIMSIGIIMIIEYLLKLLNGKNTNFVQFIKDNWKNVISYGCCYIVGLIPMIYNYYNTGYINLTSSYEWLLQEKGSIYKTFLSYIFDFNYGILPYHTVLLLTAFGLMAIAVVDRHWRFLEWILAFMVNIALYAMTVHINCGMSGIARYNMWVSSILIFAVCLFISDIIKKRKILIFAKISILIGVCITGVIVFYYGPYRASETNYMYMTPIAEFILDKTPSLYNPLHSTFNSRVSHLDGGYDYRTPIVYCAKDGYVRKILASEKDKGELLDNYMSSVNDHGWLKSKIDDLSEKESYISVPAKYKVVKGLTYHVLEKIDFCKDGYNAGNYTTKGLSTMEDWGTWTEGNEFELMLNSMSEESILQGRIKCNVYTQSQDVRIYVNDDKVFEQEEFEGGQIKFDFENPGLDQIIKLKIELPDAISPSEFGFDDMRILGLGLNSITFSESIH